jgi:hypothetical protein
MMAHHQPHALPVALLTIASTMAPSQPRPSPQDARVFATLLKDAANSADQANAASSAPPSRICEHHNKNRHYMLNREHTISTEDN